MKEDKKRCEWVTDSQLYQCYHDVEWGVPLHNDRKIFEMLILEGMQAGLSWLTVLKKRESFRLAFDNFEINKIINYDSNKIESLMQDKGIIRNRLKIESVIINAKAFTKVQRNYGSFDNFIWKYVNHEVIINSWRKISDVPTSTILSDKISKDMKKLGFKFVGSTIIYAFMQAIGMVNDHTMKCYLYQVKK